MIGACRPTNGRDSLSAQASLAGDERSAEAYSAGAIAIRLGAEPTEIAVSVGGQEYRYFAVVTGIVERGSDGAELLQRTFVAWTGAPQRTAVLRVTSRSDAAQFGRDPIAGARDQATGSFLDLERRARFVAVDGSAASLLNSIGPACPIAGRDLRFACNLARFDVRIDGTFELVGDATVRLPIETNPDGVSGVVVRRTDGGSGGRPTVTPSRPVPHPGRPVQPTRG